MRLTASPRGPFGDRSAGGAAVSSGLRLAGRGLREPVSVDDPVLAVSDLDRNAHGRPPALEAHLVGAGRDADADRLPIVLVHLEDDALGGVEDRDASGDVLRDDET